VTLAESVIHPGQPYLQALADGVHAYVQPDGGWCLNNAGIIVDGGQVLLVDTAATHARTLALRDAVRTISSTPVDTVVNTHHHGDHTHGNYVFADTARIIGHERCPAEVIAQDRLLEQIWPEVTWGPIEIMPPHETYTDTARLTVGDIDVELIHVPAAHTTNDTVVWLPDRGVLFAGDVVFSGGTPFFLMGSDTGSIAALDQLRALAPQTVVAGHGLVTDATVFETTARYLLWLHDLAQRAHQLGHSPLQAARAADLGEFANLLNPERLVANLHRAYAELDGAAPAAPIDLSAAIGDMAALGGGLPECLA
jgi:cyclase